MTVVVTGSDFPQTSEGRTRADLIDELVSYVGGEGKGHVELRAARSVDAAVRWFNNYCWRFNLVSQDITLVASTSEYDLDGDIKAPHRAAYLDSSGRVRGHLHYIDFSEYTAFMEEGTSTEQEPRYYTVANTFDAGQLRLVGNLSASPKWPTVRLWFYRRIALAPGNTSRLRVPPEFEQAMMEWMLYDMVRRERGQRESAEQRRVATGAFAMVEQVFRAWPDIALLGETEIA